MNWNEVQAGVIHSATQRFWSGMGDAADKVAEALNNNPDFVTRLAVFAKTGGYEPTTSQETARKIMGHHYLGIEHAIEYLKASPSKQDLKLLEDVPFSEEMLNTFKHTHILVAVLPMSILDIQARVDRSLFYFKDDPWYKKQAFAKEKGQAHWALVDMGIVANSKSKTWQEQQSLLDKGDETPTGRVMVYTIILNYLVTGDRLLMSVYARVSDLASGGYRVDVGYFGGNGLIVYYCWDDGRIDDIGVASARKSN